jgi:hypothetical protein
MHSDLSPINLLQLDPILKNARIEFGTQEQATTGRVVFAPKNGYVESLKILPDRGLVTPEEGEGCGYEDVTLSIPTGSLNLTLPTGHFSEELLSILSSSNQRANQQSLQYVIHLGKKKDSEGEMEWKVENLARGEKDYPTLG